MRPDHIVLDAPHLDDLSGFSQGGEDAFVQRLVAHLSVEALDRGALHRLPGRNIVPFDALLGRPVQLGLAGELGAIV